MANRLQHDKRSKQVDATDTVLPRCFATAKHAFHRSPAVLDQAPFLMLRQARPQRGLHDIRSSARKVQPHASGAFDAPPSRRWAHLTRLEIDSFFSGTNLW
jgi:hypothetical protein